MKKTIYRIALSAAALVSALACVNEQPVDFEVDTDVIEFAPEGGVKSINISSDDRWVASAQVPWITVSPANGVGSAECRIIVDSALAVTSRDALVHIENQVTKERKEFQVKQDGFDYQITLAEPTVNLASYAALADRKFNVKVKTNVPFDVVLPEGASEWIEYEVPAFNFDRGVRPREVTVKFKWNTNFNQEGREALIAFNPRLSVLYRLSSMTLRSFRRLPRLSR